MTYGIPYTVHGWGDEIVTTVVIRDECDQLGEGCGEQPPEGYTAVVRGTEPGPVILIPTAALTPVDTTPPEPEPGVYFIGDDGEAWQRFEDRDDEQRWCGVGYEPLCTWAEVWAHTAGRPQRVPDTTIRRLVPEPAPVELPWERDDVSGCTFRIGPVGNSGRLLVQVWIEDAGEVTRHAFEPDDAEAAATALLSTARAAREATP